MIGDLNKEQIDNFLKSQVVGRVGCCFDHKPYIVPLTYAYDGGYLYFHTKAGLKVEMMRKNPAICFQVDRIENMANWQSVIIWGSYEELGPKESELALRLLSNRVIPVITSETFRPHFGLDRGHATMDSKLQLVTFRIKVERATGRYEKSQ